jgi:hypothetical protein
LILRLPSLAGGVEKEERVKKKSGYNQHRQCAPVHKEESKKEGMSAQNLQALIQVVIRHTRREDGLAYPSTQTKEFIYKAPL